MTQQPLFKLHAQPQLLTNRQAVGLSFLRDAGHDGLRPQELGELMFGQPSRYAKSTGLDLLKALKKKGHARQTRGGIYIALELAPEPLGDLPEGY